MSDPDMGILDRLFPKPAPDRRIGTTSRSPSASPRTVPRSELPDGQRTSKPAPLAQEDADAFADGAVVHVLSSHVDRAQYDSETQTLYIWYIDGPCWAYSPYTPAEAAAFIRSPSKGGWLASWVRVAGKGNQHKHQRNARPVG